MRVRSVLSFAIHQFFKTGFCYVHTPIITGSDAECGRNVSVSVLDPQKPPVDADGTVDFNKTFWKSNLTVSGQLKQRPMPKDWEMSIPLGPLLEPKIRIPRVTSRSFG